jgi:hypothetical protein
MAAVAGGLAYVRFAMTSGEGPAYLYGLPVAPVLRVLVVASNRVYERRFIAYANSIEDDFLGGQRLDPATDGRPDPRPGMRENNPILGDLAADFDFTHKLLPPLLLPVHPTMTLTGTPQR